MANILFLGGGRRVELAHLFQARGHDVFAYELSHDVPVGDCDVGVILGVPWNNPYLADHVAAARRQYEIDLVVPLDDRAACDYPVGGCYTAAQTCYDKARFADFFRPDKHFTWYPFPVRGKPAVIKPVHGHGSNGITFVDQWDGTTPAGMVVQKRIFGREFTVDAYFNKSGTFVGASPRLRIRVAGGEVVESKTVQADGLNECVRQVGEDMGVNGPCCFQFIEDRETGCCKVLEANCRLGGGATLSIEAGFDMVGWLVDEYVKGGCVQPGDKKARPDVYMTRSYRDHFFAGAA
jgi:hypothetical protein